MSAEARARLIAEHGPDRLVAVGERLEVWTPREMVDWQVRRHRRIAVSVEGVRYFVAERSFEGEKVRYLLAPWTDDLRDQPGAEIVYDAGYVEQRDRTRRARGLAEGTSTLLNLFSPLIGFLWSGVKARLHERHGVDAAKATSRALSVQLAVALFVSTILFIFGGAEVMVLLWLVFGVDMLFRKSSLMEGEGRYLGFYEWPVALMRGRPKDSGHYALQAEQTKRAQEAEAARAFESSDYARLVTEDLAAGAPTRAYGPDAVFRRGEDFVVHAGTAMPAWKARETLAVHVEGVRCRVVEASEHAGRGRYRLTPWPMPPHALAVQEIHYHGDFVREREEERAAISQARKRHRVLVAFSALIGFLWSDTKRDLEDRYGVSARRGTFLSCILEIAASLMFGAIYSVAYGSSSSTVTVRLYGLLAVLLAVDGVLRWLIVLRERGEHLGFLELPRFFLRRSSP